MAETILDVVLRLARQDVAAEHGGALSRELASSETPRLADVAQSTADTMHELRLQRDLAADERLQSDVERGAIPPRFPAPALVGDEREAARGAARILPLGSLPRPAEARPRLPEAHDLNSALRPDGVVRPTDRPDADASPIEPGFSAVGFGSGMNNPQSFQSDRPSLEAPALSAVDSLVPPFAAAPRAANERLQDTPLPEDSSATMPGNAGQRQFVEAVDDGSRQLEQALHDLESSLTNLFQTQIETLNRLRDQTQQHERRWTEQTAARRAAFASS